MDLLLLSMKHVEPANLAWLILPSQGFFTYSDRQKTMTIALVLRLKAYPVTLSSF